MLWCPATICLLFVLIPGYDWVRSRRFVSYALGMTYDMCWDLLRNYSHSTYGGGGGTGSLCRGTVDRVILPKTSGDVFDLVENHTVVTVLTVVIGYSSVPLSPFHSAVLPRLCVRLDRLLVKHQDKKESASPSVLKTNHHRMLGGKYRSKPSFLSMSDTSRQERRYSHLE